MQPHGVRKEQVVWRFRMARGDSGIMMREHIVVQPTFSPGIKPDWLGESIYL